jgi:hypothetical protein
MSRAQSLLAVSRVWNQLELPCVGKIQSNRMSIRAIRAIRVSATT